MNDLKLTKLNKMGVKPVGKLLATMSLPAIFSMFVSALYNVVDSLFVARQSAAGLDALSIAFPLQMVALSVALGVGVGTNTIVARRLGEGNKEEANQFAQTGLLMAMVFGALFILIGGVTPKAFMQAFSTNSEVIRMGTNYLMICVMCTMFVTIEMTVSKTLQGTGNMIIPMISQLLGALINIALDPIMIFVLKLGTTGAAIATVVGQLCSMIFVLIMASRRSHIIQIFFKNFKLKWRRVSIILRVGAPAMIMNAVGGFTTMLMNGILAKFSEKAITVLGIYFKVQSFVFMPVFGLNQGALPILSFNYGANKQDRYKKCMFYAICVALFIMALGTLLFQFAPEIILKLFNAEEEVMTIGVKAFKAISWIFIPAAVGIVVSTAYQSLGYGFTSLIMSLMRQVAITLPCAILFGKLWGLDAVWYSYLIAELIPMLIFTPLLFFVAKHAFARKHAASLEMIAESEEVAEIEFINEELGANVPIMDVSGINDAEYIDSKISEDNNIEKITDLNETDNNTMLINSDCDDIESDKIKE